MPDEYAGAAKYPDRHSGNGINVTKGQYPGDRVQMDTIKIAPGIVQYSANNGPTRFCVLRLYERITAANTLLLIEPVMGKRCLLQSNGLSLIEVLITYQYFVNCKSSDTSDDICSLSDFI